MQRWASRPGSIKNLGGKAEAWSWSTVLSGAQLSIANTEGLAVPGESCFVGSPAWEAPAVWLIGSITKHERIYHIPMDVGLRSGVQGHAWC